MLFKFENVMLLLWLYYLYIAVAASSGWTCLYSSSDNTRDYGATRLSTNECPTVIPSSNTVTDCNTITDPFNGTKLNPTAKPSQPVRETYLSKSNLTRHQCASGVHTTSYSMATSIQQERQNVFIDGLWDQHCRN